MKYFPFILWAVFGLVLSLPVTQAEEQEWTNNRGQIIRAEFVSATKDTMTISMKGKTYVVKLADLSPESQALARKLAEGVSTDKLTPEDPPPGRTVPPSGFR